MKFKHIVFSLILLSSVQNASATVSLFFNGDGYTGLIAGLADAAGVPTNNMRWGIVVSTTNGTFEGVGANNYDAYASGPTTQGFLSFGGAFTDDYYIPGGLTQNTSNLDEGNFTFTGGNGGIANNISGIALTGDIAGLGLGAGITTGDKFALIWFATNSSASGDSYGILTNPGFVIPSNGNTEDAYLASFEGVDPARPATQTFAGAGVIPEPSRMMLLGFGLVGLFFRRRR
jgi:hypothetical protein